MFEVLFKPYNEGEERKVFNCQNNLIKNNKYVLDFIIFIGRIKYKYYMEDLFMSKYYSINKFSKILGVSAQTLRNWDKKGKLHPHHTSSNGYRYYSHEQLKQENL